MEIKPPTTSQPTANTAAPNSGAASPRPAGEAPALVPGRVLTALVESSQQIAQARVQGAQGNLFSVMLKVDGKPVETQSNQAFLAGQQLRIQILTDSSIKVLQVLQNVNAPLKAELPLIQQGLREALPLQQNTTQLLNNLLSLKQLLTHRLAELNTAGKPGQSNAQQLVILRNANARIEQLIGQLPKAQEVGHAPGLKQSLNNSGLFLEQRLRQAIEKFVSSQITQPNQSNKSQPNMIPRLDLRQLGNGSSQNNPLKSPSQSQQQIDVRSLLQAHPPLAQAARDIVNQDFKAQLLSLVRNLAPVLKESLAQQTGQNVAPGSRDAQSAPNSTASTSTASGRESQSAAATLINRIIQALPQQAGAGPPGTGRPEGDAAGRQTLQISQPLQLLNAAPNLNLAHLLSGPAAPQANARNADRMDLATSTILRQLAASLARVQSNQFSSLASQQGGPDAATPQTLYLEIPVFNHGQFRPIQLQIERRLESQNSEESHQDAQWKITLGFDFEELGLFYATLSVIRDSVSATFWSEQQSTLQRITQELDVLQSSLSKLGLEVKQIDCRRGTPLMQRTRLEQQLVDIRT